MRLIAEVICINYAILPQYSSILEISEGDIVPAIFKTRDRFFLWTTNTTMPLLKKKIYNLTPSPKNLKASEELFVIPETKECFRSYEYLFIRFLIVFIDGCL